MSYTFGRNTSRQSSSEDRNFTVALPSNSLCTPKPLAVQKINEFYDHVEAHLIGVTKVLKPMLEINNIILEEFRGCKSEDHFNRGKSTGSELSYYTPQRTKCGSATSRDQGQCCCKLDQNPSRQKLTAGISRNCSTKKTTFQSSVEPICSTKLSKPENKCCKAPSQRSSISSGNKSSGCSQKKSNNTSTFESKNCSICGININEVKVLAAVPCKHLFCYSCMSRIELNACPKCWKPIKRETMKNITNK